MRRVSINSKLLSVILCIVVICVLTLTLAYAALSVTLNIQGNANIVASSWNLYLDNVKVEDGSVSANAPIVSGVSLSFGAALTNPGDYYEFTVDVVNDGTIDAMINGITKTPELTTEQKKYLNYIVEYENGESITTKQLVESKGLVRLRVKVEFRKDISISDLPSSSMTLNSSFSVNYVQADGSESSVVNSGVDGIPFSNGDIEKIGTIVTIGTEKFYTFGVEDGNVKLLSMYNLHVGDMVSEDEEASVWSNPTGMQSSIALGSSLEFIDDNFKAKNLPWYGLVAFADDNKHGLKFNDYAGSLVESYVNDYKVLLENYFEINVEEARLISYDELTDSKTFACDADLMSCVSSPYSWIYSTTYWTGTSGNDNAGSIWSMHNDGGFGKTSYFFNLLGVRPVIVISKDYFK